MGAQYKIPLWMFLSLFPRTFAVSGSNGEFVRILRRSRHRITDVGEEAMVRLALSREQGCVEPSLAGDFSARSGRSSHESSHLQRVRARAEYRSMSDPNLTIKLPAI